MGQILFALSHSSVNILNKDNTLRVACPLKQDTFTLIGLYVSFVIVSLHHMRCLFSSFSYVACWDHLSYSGLLSHSSFLWHFEVKG